MTDSHKNVSKSEKLCILLFFFFLIFVNFLTSIIQNKIHKDDFSSIQTISLVLFKLFENSVFSLGEGTLLGSNIIQKHGGKQPQKDHSLKIAFAENMYVFAMNWIFFFFNVWY